MNKLYLNFFAFIVLLLTSCVVCAQDQSPETYRALLIQNAAGLGITTEEAEAAAITHAYTDKATRITYIYLQQTYQQIKVYNTIITAAFIDGNLQYTSGAFVKDIAAKAGAPVRSKTYTDAIRGAARHLKLNEAAPLVLSRDAFAAEKKYMVAAGSIAQRPIETSLYWTVADDKQQVTLAWNVNIQVKDKPDWWNVRINAQTGEFIQKDNWTVSEKESEGAIPNTPFGNRETPFVAQPLSSPAPWDITSATYRVIPFPYESPARAAFANESNPWLKVGTTNNATTYGWHFDNIVNYNITRGNNVFAFLDRRANSTPDATRNWPDTSLTASPNLSFIHSIDTTQQPWSNTENKKAALDNLFYWNNLMHDMSYQYGFTEAAGNFQTDNVGRGGVAYDPVMAHAQDSAGFNNAYFTVPVDGYSGTMQMYTWATPPKFNITAPQDIAGSFTAMESAFTAPNKLYDRGPVTGRIVWYNDDTAGTIHRGCVAAANASAIAGNIVMLDVGDGTNCTTNAYRVKNAQNAGATAVIAYYSNNSTANIGGAEATLTIPAIVITKATADVIAARLNAGQVVNAAISAGIHIDSDFDNGIICHEYGHGISCRLTGGPWGSACLNNAEQAGEGWSDYFGLMMTTNWATATVTDGSKLRSIGTYAAGQLSTAVGLRRYYYTTNMAANGLTYAHMASNTEVHATGEIWCSAIWDMTWNIIQQQNSITPDIFNSTATGGNIIAMNLVMTGLKLQPCSPGFLDSRDAILAADSILYGYAHRCAIWSAFARRGMGYSAKQGLSTSATDQTAAFDLPSTITISQSTPVIVNAGDNYTFTRRATCNCQAGTYTLIDTIPAGFTYISSTPAGTLNGNVLSFPATAFASTESKDFSITVQAPVTGCTIDTVINDNRETATVGGFTSSGMFSSWSATTAKAHSGNASWFAPDSWQTTSASLTSTATSADTTKSFSILSFWHYYRTRTAFNGSVLEYSTDGGSTWTDAAPLIISNGYNTTMTAGVLYGRRAFSGNSISFKQTVVNLSALGTTPVLFRFRMETLGGSGVEGWYVDDIVRANGCGGILRSGIYNSTGLRIDGAAVPVFVGPALPTLITYHR